MPNDNETFQRCIEELRMMKSELSKELKNVEEDVNHKLITTEHIMIGTMILFVSILVVTALLL